MFRGFLREVLAGMVARGELPKETANVIDQPLFNGLATLDREWAGGEGNLKAND
jgi:hypothetical protein